MFKIDKSINRISRLKNKSFSDLGFKEREHLQEWLANQPDALGEDLLIIQKEFDGFDDTRERLDLLALDKDGSLVVIENKLDDTGRDVVWQALKYASYCSSLSKNQIIEIYQEYLNKYCGGGDAKSSICEFLSVPDISEVVLNAGNNQRLVFVAANYRKEVTSTALWLLTHNIQLQCFKVTPYSLLINDAEELFLNVDQIIPPPEAKELMIGMSVKEAEEKEVVGELKNRHKMRLAFWEMALEEFKTSQCDLYNNKNASKDHWLNAGSGISGCPFTMVCGVKEIGVEFWFSKQDTQDNKFMYDWMFERKDIIESKFGDQLEWFRLDDKKSSRVQIRSDFDGKNKDNWPEMIEWLIDHMIRFEAALKPHLGELNKLVKAQSEKY
ncbi:DUF4268 domain-containing protein [Thalassotalea sp. ND16A]|uniref:DUF4268 domain-containing protein n=1 Tax=Thalassotalea sp. ND16A TaxID=1535422 RepID=UPI00051A5CD4|nr:DUF4268 domain-containing protein [Thalassotalea sp. ND16A]KGJ92084.1 hypothetical protein ND16A_1778 [Thalassotalea sp. ND16A]